MQADTIQAATIQADTIQADTAAPLCKLQGHQSLPLLSLISSHLSEPAHRSFIHNNYVGLMCTPSPLIIGWHQGP